jgi:predicted transcriptional regulator
VPRLAYYASVSYAAAMAVDRLSVTVPSKLGRELRKLAKARGTTVSNVVADAVAHQVRLAALDVALAEAERRFGPLPPESVAQAEADLVAGVQRAAGNRRLAEK